MFHRVLRNISILNFPTIKGDPHYLDYNSLCQKYPYKARKKCMEKTSWHNDYYYISMQISQENKKNPGRF